MGDNDIDTELYGMLLQFVLLSRQLSDAAYDYNETLLQRMELAAQLRQRGFMISEQQIEMLDERLLH